MTACGPCPVVVSDGPRYLHGQHKKYTVQPILTTKNKTTDSYIYIREIHPLEPQRHRHSMLAPRVCAPRVTRCSIGHVLWSVQLACSILSRSDSCQGDGRQRCMHSARSRSTHLTSTCRYGSYNHIRPCAQCNCYDWLFSNRNVISPG